MWGQPFIFFSTKYPRSGLRITTNKRQKGLKTTACASSQHAWLIGVEISNERVYSDLLQSGHTPSKAFDIFVDFIGVSDFSGVKWFCKDSLTRFRPRLSSAVGFAWYNFTWALAFIFHGWSFSFTCRNFLAPTSFVFGRGKSYTSWQDIKWRANNEITYEVSSLIVLVGVEQLFFASRHVKCHLTY